MAKQSNNQRDFLLTFFQEPHTIFDLVRVNNFILNRYIDGNNNKAYVAVYTLESFARSHPAKLLLAKRIRACVYYECCLKDNQIKYCGQTPFRCCCFRNDTTPSERGFFVC